MIRHLSINLISVYVTVLVVLINLILFYHYSDYTELQFNGTILLVYMVLSFGLTYATIRFFLATFVFRKIRSIYKIIYNSKAGNTAVTNESPSLFNADLTEVNEQVVEWAKSTESEIKNLKKLEEYRRNFLGNISHELKTPIFSIQGYLHTLLDGGLDDKKINKRYIERAASNAERLQNIVDDLDVINKLEENTALDLSKFDVKELVDEVFKDLEMISKKRKIKLEFDDEFAQSFIVEADREKIRQVLVNLIMNSIKYGGEKGETKVGFHNMEEKVLIEISDNGIGIGEKHLLHLFDRFYRVDTSRSRKLGGSGLGLSIVKHIIEAHDQNINVQSTIGEGSSFSFTLDSLK